MCGLVGIFNSKGDPDSDRALLVRMTDRLIHRGPDDSGCYTGPGICLGHRRLSIIDLGGGKQPMFNEDGSVVVVFNGEIYNHRTLAKELSAKGHRFQTKSDTEVIVHAWEEWGESCVEQFRGMFAFALWDQRQQILFLARDRLGIKPLYYATLTDGTVLFGSELKALLSHPMLPRKIDVAAVEEYFAYGYVPDPKTIYETVFKLPPGHHLSCLRDKPLPSSRPYWDLHFGAKQPISEAAAREELISLLEEAVGIRMVADVPLGAFLSGGINSSSVVAMMARQSSTPISTCSIGFDETQHDKSPYARQVAEAYQTCHHSRQTDPYALDLMDKIAGIYDEPFADNSAFPTYQLCGLTREHVTVALSGDGGDELFAGYRRHLWHRYEEAVRAICPPKARRGIFGLLGAVYPKMDWGPRYLRAKSTFQALAGDSVMGYFRSLSRVPDEIRQQIYSSNMKQALQGYHAVEVIHEHMKGFSSGDPLDRAQYIDLKTYLPGNILTKVDRASMAHSLEVRVPFLDHLVVEWAARLPSDLRLKGRKGKYILKSAMAPFLDQSILDRKKVGFAVPLSLWLRGPLRHWTTGRLTGSALDASGLFDMNAIASLVDQHQKGLRDNSAAIWALLMFDSFIRQVHEGDFGVKERGNPAKV